MAKLEITIATWDCDRVPPEERFHRAWHHQDFDVTEIGLSGYTIGTSRGIEKPEDLHWMQGGMDDPGRRDKWRISPYGVEASPPTLDTPKT